MRESQKDQITENEMLRCFASEFQSIQTRRDGNCLFHMVSNGLVGNETLTYVFKALTTFGLVVLKEKILKLIS